MFALAAILTLALTPASEPDAAPVIAAERAFAADAPGLGIAGSFGKWSTPEAVMIAGGQVSTARAVYPPDAERPTDEPKLEWWPNFAGIARSGDLGFTTGGVEVNDRRAGHYFTVWKRQADGRWLWVYDGGPRSTAADAPGPETEPDILPTSTAASIASATAMAQVREVEATLAEAARTDQAAAHQARLGEIARLYVGTRPPATTPAAHRAALSAWPAAFDFAPSEGGGASEAGDMVWTYGPVRWREASEDRRGHFVRLWQREAADGGDRWVLAVAYLLEAPRAAPAT